MSRKDAVRSPLRWAGSKRKLLPVLEPFWREGEGRYIEAFAGSACLFFHLRPASATLNDTNRSLVDAYSVLAQQPSLLHATLLEFPVNKATYDWFRSEFDPVDKFESAVRFFYLNRFCFNGIYRTNKQGKFNVPYAGYGTGAFPSLGAWQAAAHALKGVELTSEDFEVVVKRTVRKNDFVYMDPPYAVSNRRVFTQYSANEFGLDDLQRLRSVMRHVDSVGAKFVVSYAQSPETSMLTEGWHSVRKMAQRNVAGFAHNRRRAVEVLITNDPARLPIRGR